MKIANQELSKVLGRANECMRRLIEAGLTFEDLQSPIDDPQMRERLVRYWKNPIIALARSTITINRSKGFYLKDWQGNKEWPMKYQDERALLLNEVDLNGVMFETGLPSNGWADVASRILNLKDTGRIFLDAYVFQVLWENQELIPETWKTKIILFAGTTFGKQYEEFFKVPCLVYYDNEWHKNNHSSVDYNNDEKIVIATIADFSN
jgi:hypothetical protein